MVRLHLLLVAGLLVAGCARDDAPDEMPLVRDEVFVHIQLVQELPSKSGKRYGQATCANQVCKISLLKRNYPFCLAHELRHLFEGSYHGDRPSLEDCAVAVP